MCAIISNQQLCMRKALVDGRIFHIQQIVALRSEMSPNLRFELLYSVY